MALLATAYSTWNPSTDYIEALTYGASRENVAIRDEVTNDPMQVGALLDWDSDIIQAVRDTKTPLKMSFISAFTGLQYETPIIDAQRLSTVVITAMFQTAVNSLQVQQKLHDKNGFVILGNQFEIDSTVFVNEDTYNMGTTAFADCCGAAGISFVVMPPSSGNAAFIMGII